jgi:hypothetical protein
MSCKKQLKIYTLPILSGWLDESSIHREEHVTTGETCIPTYQGILKVVITQPIHMLHKNLSSSSLGSMNELQIQNTNYIINKKTTPGTSYMCYNKSIVKSWRRNITIIVSAAWWEEAVPCQLTKTTPHGGIDSLFYNMSACMWRIVHICKRHA